LNGQVLPDMFIAPINKTPLSLYCAHSW